MGIYRYRIWHRISLSYLLPVAIAIFKSPPVSLVLHFSDPLDRFRSERPRDLDSSSREIPSPSSSHSRRVASLKRRYLR